MAHQLLVLLLMVSGVFSVPGSVLENCKTFKKGTTLKVLCRCGEVDFNGLSTSEEGSWDGDVDLTVYGCPNKTLDVSFGKGVFPYLSSLILTKINGIYFKESQVRSSSLKLVAVYKSAIKSLPMYSFHGLMSLDSLTFSESTIDEVKSYAFNVSVTEGMRISSCKVGNVGQGAFSLNLFGSSSLCNDQQPLTKLEISHNRFDTLESNAFQASCVKEFDFTGNTIKTINAKAFGLNIHNGILKIEDNKIDTVKMNAFLNISNSIQVNGIFRHNMFKVVEKNGLITDTTIEIKENLFDCCRPESYRWFLDTDDKAQSSFIEQRHVLRQTGVCSVNYQDEVFKRLKAGQPLNSTFEGHSVLVYSLQADGIPECDRNDDLPYTGKAAQTQIGTCLILLMMSLLYRMFS